MTPLFIPRIDSLDIDALKEGLSFKTISYLGAVYTKVRSQDVEQAFQFLDQVVTEYGTGLAVLLDLTELPADDQNIVSLLDAGASTIVVFPEQLEHVGQEYKDLDSNRLLLKLPGNLQDNKTQLLDAPISQGLGVCSEDANDAVFLRDWFKDHKISDPRIYVSLGDTDDDALERRAADVIECGGIPIVAASSLTTEKEAKPNLTSIQSLLHVKSDRPDGLLSTVVTDERGVALGFVFSTPESIRESLKTGRGVYHSRKRGLWYKGDSSGDIQELVRIEMDCDRDCLKFVVRQRGKGRFTWSFSLPIEQLG